MTQQISPESGSFTRHSTRYTLILFLVLFLAVIALFHTFVFSDKMLYGSDTIQAGVLFRSFYVDYVHQHGAVPVWNPYQFCGIPYIDGFHGDTFYPFSILKFFISIYRALGWNLLLHVFFAGLTMFGCARVFKRSLMASTLAAVAYMFAAYFVSQVAPGHDGKMYATALFPLTIMLIELAFATRWPLFYFSLLGLTIGIIILTPHVQIAYYTLWVCAFYFLLKLYARYRETKAFPSLVKPTGLFVMAVVLGLGISAIHFYSGYVYVSKYSPRSDEKRGEEWARSWSLGPEEAFSVVVPEFCGVNNDTENSYWGRNAFKDNSEYCGVIPLLLALVAVTSIRTRTTWFFGGLAIFALIYGLAGNTPFFYLFFYLIPNVKSTRAWSMIMFLFSFSIALLAAFGLDFIIEKSRKLKAKERQIFDLALWGLPVLVIVGALFFAAAPAAAIGIYKSIFYSTITQQKDMALQNHLGGISAGFWITSVFLIIAAGAAWMYSRKKAGLLILWLIIGVAFIDAYRFDLKFIKTFDQNTTFGRTPIVDYFQSLPGKFRVLTFNSRYLSTNYLPMFGIEEMTSYHGSQPRWYQNLLGGTSMKNLGLNLMNLTDTKYILISPDSPIKGDQLAASGFVEKKRLQNLQVFENPYANERAYLVHQWMVEPNEDAVDRTILAPGFDTRHMAALMESPGIQPSPDTLLAASDRATIETYENNRIVVKTSSKADGILVLCDNWYPAWKGFVDGREVPVMRTNGAFRGVVLTAGVHTVEFKFISSEEKTGRLITFAGLLFVGAVTVMHFASRRKKKELPSKESSHE